MTKQNKADEQGGALTPGAIATMRELGWSEAQIEAERQNAERIRAAGGFKNWVVMCEAARIASEARGYTVEPEAFKRPTWFQDARAELDSAAARPRRTSIVGWGHRFALELAVLNGKEQTDRTHAHRFEQAMLHAARNGNLRMRTFDIVGAPVEVTADMADYVIAQLLAADPADVRTWAAAHWPELLQSRLLAEPAPESPPAGEAVTIAGPGKMGNSTKDKRAQPLSAEIEAAKLEATNPADVYSVYAVLQRWAEKCKTPFIGFAEGEGCKYQTSAGTVAFFTLGALRKRMSRAANAR